MTQDQGVQFITVVLGLAAARWEIKVEKLGNAARLRIFEDEDPKVLYLCPCSSLDVLSERITTSSPNFGLLVAMDARGVKNQEIWQAAEKLVAKGLVCLCVWGPECERVHDSFDETINERELDAGLEGRMKM